MNTIDQFRPIDDHILVQRERDGEMTASGLLFIPDSARKQNGTVARVLAVGPGKLTRKGVLLPMPVAKGYRIIVDTYAGARVGDCFGVSAEELQVIDTDNVLAIVEAE